MIPETTRGTFGAFRDPGPTCPQARCESHVIRAPFSAKERDSGSVYTYDTPPEKSRVTSRGQFSLTSTNVVIPTTLPQRLQGLYRNHMRHLWETMTGQGTQGQGRNQRPVTSTPTPRVHHAARPPNRYPGLASAPLMRSKRRPPHPKHPKFAQFHRSGLHFGHTPYNWKHVEGVGLGWCC